MRLNLADFNCAEFELLSEFIVPPSKNAEIEAFMRQTMVQDLGDAENQALIARFASKSEIAGITHRYIGTLTKKQSKIEMGYALSITGNLAPDDLPPPPPDLEPVVGLVDAAAKLFGPVAVGYTAAFNYKQSQGYQSKIHFPVPLISPQGPNNITHIENALFSSRNSAGGVEYLILVESKDDTDSLAHSVNFSTVIELSHNSIRELLDRARSISTRLLIQPGD